MSDYWKQITVSKNGAGLEAKDTTHRANRGRGVGETHALRPGVGIVSVDTGWVHQFWGLAVFEGEVLEGGAPL